MRRGPGISGLQHAAKARERYQNMGDEVRKDNLAAMKDQMSQFKSKLEEFAVAHRNEIRKDPAFRAAFHTMCANIGVDPLASNKGLWAKTLGFGDFYYELGVQIVEACWATRAHNGGLMELPALLKYVHHRRGSRADPISEDDVVRSIKKLNVLGSGFDLVKIGKRTYVRSVPGELNMDKNRILELAQENSLGYISKDEIKKRTDWLLLRIETVLDGLLAEGVAMVDDQDPSGIRLYWFPCLVAQE
eukprot:gene15632-21739_t